MEPVSVRRLVEADIETACRIFFDSVRIGTQGHYDEFQRRAWAPRVPDPEEWRHRLTSQTTLVAEIAGNVVGFMTLSRDGRLDLAYIAPDFMGRGVGDKLYERIEIEARELGIRVLSTEASHLARAFLERKGWSVIEQQTVSPNEVPMINFVMEKDLR